MNSTGNDAPILIIGAGLAGLSAALTIARTKRRCRLISVAPPERAQSVLAEGGTNAVLDTMGDHDTVEEHIADTMRGGCFLADEKAVRRLCETAPHIIRDLEALGVPFNRNADGTIAQRYFGGQKKRRTAFAGAMTGKMLMSALIDAVRKYEADDLVERYDHHAFCGLLHTERTPDEEQAAQGTSGVYVQDLYTEEMLSFEGPVILCSGGLNGLFPGHTTGTAYNTGEVTAIAFTQGIRLANLEMIQYHPTTVAIPGKRLLVTEAARGEGGRLFVEKKGAGGEILTAPEGRYYFMEERYPALGNLMPRDVVSREIDSILADDHYGGRVFLDMTGIPADVWDERLAELREEILHYLGPDPAKVPVPVAPGIHYFMGGIDADAEHRTSLAGVYAAGECCALYHGANRLGGNSTMGAMAGGRVAAESAMRYGCDIRDGRPGALAIDPLRQAANRLPEPDEELGDILREGLGIVRNEASLQRALRRVTELERTRGNSTPRILLAKAMLKSAMQRKESRGAHYRGEYPETLDACRRKTVIYATDL